MAKKFIIQFDAPEDVDGSLEFVIDENTLQSDSDSGSKEPISGPLTKVTSPSILIAPLAGVQVSPSKPDVEILPTNSSTTGQADIIYRSASTGITMVWTEPVTGFGVGNVQITTTGDVHMARATLSDFAAHGASGDGSASTYTAILHFPASGSGLVTVTIPQNSAVAANPPAYREGPPLSRYRGFSYDFARGRPRNTPEVSIQPPAGNPFVGRKGPIKFVWNVPITTATAAQNDDDMILNGFTASDVTFTDNMGNAVMGVTMTEPMPSCGNRVWEAELTLPAVSSATEINITVTQNSVTSEEGLQGPSPAEVKQFTFNTSTASTQGKPSGTTLLCDMEFDVGEMTPDALEWLSPKFGAFYGITDLTKIGDQLYGVAQIRRHWKDNTNELADSQEAAAALFVVKDLTGSTTIDNCDVIKSYPRILEAARSLTGHRISGDTQDHLYFFEGSHYIYQVASGSGNPINNDKIGELMRFNTNQLNSCPVSQGKVWRIALGRQSGNTFEEHFGVAGGTASPMLSGDGKLWALPGVGNLSFVNYAANRRYLFLKSSSEPNPPEGLTYNPTMNMIENLGGWQISQPPNDDNFLGLFEDNIYLQQVELDTRYTPARVRLVGEVETIPDDFIDASAGIAYGLPTASTGDTISTLIDNWSLLTYSQTIEPRLEFIPTNDNTTWALLLEFARLTNCILHFHDNLVFFKPRIPIRVDLDADLGAGITTMFNRAGATRPFPDTGTVIIGNEIIDYDSGETAALTRGRYHTANADHDSGDSVTYVDHVLSSDVFVTPVEDLVMDSDATNIYNVIEVIYDNGTREHTEKDAASIEKHSERIFTINAPFLSNHQNQWAEWSAKTALETFKDLQYIIRLNLTPRFDIEVGDYVYLNIPRDDIRRIGLVIRVIYDSESNVTEVDLRTITP